MTPTLPSSICLQCSLVNLLGLGNFLVNNDTKILYTIHLLNNFITNHIIKIDLHLFTTKRDMLTFQSIKSHLPVICPFLQYIQIWLQTNTVFIWSNKWLSTTVKCFITKALEYKANLNFTKIMCMHYSVLLSNEFPFM